jgi:hypothetical protein
MRRKPSPLLAKFRLRCDTRGRYFTVLIFRDKEAMQRFHLEQAKLVPGVSRLYRFTALTRLWGWPAKPRFSGPREIGQIQMYHGATGSGIVSHECTHAALYWFQRYSRWRLKDLAKRAADERLAWVQGSLVSQFWRNFYRLKLDRA